MNVRAMGPFTFIYYLLPTLILLAPLCWSRLLKSYDHHQAFGNPSTYLDLDLEPISFSEKKDRLGFTGVLSTDLLEEKIKGFRMKSNGYTWYVFESPTGQFIGWLMNGKKGCEPELHYQFQKHGKQAETGVLKAAFCL